MLGILETTKLCAVKVSMLVLDSNTWSSVTLCKQMIDIR